MKNVKRTLSMVLALIMTLSVMFVAVPQKEADAAVTWRSMKLGYIAKNVYFGDKVNGYAVFVSGNKLKCGKTVSGATTIKTIPSGYKFEDSLVTDGNKVLFSVTRYVSGGRKVYFFKFIAGKNTCEKLGTASVPASGYSSTENSGKIVAYYNGEIYYTGGLKTWDTLNSTLCKYNLSTKKAVRLSCEIYSRNYSGSTIFASYGENIVGVSFTTGEYSPEAYRNLYYTRFISYNMKTKAKKTFYSGNKRELYAGGLDLESFYMSVACDSQNAYLWLVNHDQNSNTTSKYSLTKYSLTNGSSVKLFEKTVKNTYSMTRYVCIGLNQTNGIFITNATDTIDGYYGKRYRFNYSTKQFTNY